MASLQDVKVTIELESVAGAELKTGATYLIRVKSVRTHEELMNANRYFGELGERLGVKFVIVGKDCELVNAPQLETQPDFVLAVESVVRRMLERTGR